MAVAGGQYRATPVTYTDLDMVEALPTDVNGNLMVNIAAGEKVTIDVGTITTGTIDVLKAGTITALANGTIGAGTINTLGTVANINAGSIRVTTGTIDAFTADIPGGTIDSVSAIAAATINTIGTVSKLESGSIAVVAGTIGAGTINTVGKWSSYTGTVVIPTSDTVQSGTLASSLNGLIHAVSMVTPAMESTGTATLTLVDQLGANIISQAQNESVTAAYGTVMPVTSSMNWVVTANGTQSADATVTFAVHYEL